MLSLRILVLQSTDTSFMSDESVQLVLFFLGSAVDEVLIVLEVEEQLVLRKALEARLKKSWRQVFPATQCLPCDTPFFVGERF